MHATVMELDTCDRDCMVHNASNIYCLALYRKGRLTPGPYNRNSEASWQGLSEAAQLTGKVPGICYLKVLYHKYLLSK